MKTFKFMALAAVSLSLFSCTKDKVEVSGVSVSPDEVSLMVGETCKLSAVVSPDDAVYSEIVWTSSDEAVASVAQDGLVTAVSSGNAEIYAAVGEKRGACKVSVSVPAVPVESVVISETSLDIQVGDVVELTFQIYPEDADYSEIIWTSSDETVASVEDGKVTGLAEGTAEVVVSVDGVSASCSVTVTKPLPAATGDYYYSDGTWSAELDPSKTAVGIVFYTGNPAADDAALAREHPECVNGLVVALGETMSAWQPSYAQQGALVGDWIKGNVTDYETVASSWGFENALNRIMGYNNTKAIQEFNAATENSSWPVTAVESVEEYAASVPAPENTSGWYLPSAKELSLLCSGEYDDDIFFIYDMTEIMQQVNPKIEKAAGTVLSGQYWSSTEDADEQDYAWYVSFMDGSVSSTNKATEEFKVRPVLAF